MIQVVSSLSSERAWARNRISSTMTDAMVMALRHDRARSGSRCQRPGRSSASPQFSEIGCDSQRQCETDNPWSALVSPVGVLVTEPWWAFTGNARG
jgi:hypothetical protein